MFKKRTLALAASVVAAGLLLAGCSGSGSGGGSTGTLKFYTDKAAWKPQFQSLNPTSQKDVKISLSTTGYSDENQYQAFVKQSFRTQQSPGLFTWATGDQLTQLVDQKLVADTSSIWKGAIADGSVSKDLEKYYTFDGKQYCVPMNIAYWVMYYNKKIFDKYGIQKPTTWKELMDDAAKLKQNGVTPFYQTSTLFTFPWFETLVAGTDPKLYNGLADGSVKYTDPRIVAIMNEWLAQEKKGWFSDPGSKTDPAQMLKQGDMAMINFGTFFGASLDGVGMKAGSDYDYFIIPSVDPSLSKTPVPVETGPMCVAQSSKQKDLGLAYSKWWMTPGAQTAWSNARGDVPFNPKAQVKDAGLKKLGQDVSGGNYQLVTRYFEAAPTPILNVALEEFGAFSANPGDPKPFLQKIQDAADKYWASKK
ncbi:ABC transporter substrate-binding protein [Leifsonia shinshuensis]|uniref:Extracellular solute-binding protein n=1 Tax=Leifsonia shinshuensis TaxID=150026 RepID=A0A7G6Y9Y4_9MICO|nr:extracellular solute-binding protein [Leifsonia shinshuensis]QNE35299.1 extracellular solute-binding protein [Leifsonia shinshuensis]